MCASFGGFKGHEDLFRYIILLKSTTYSTVNHLSAPASPTLNSRAPSKRFHEGKVKVNVGSTFIIEPSQLPSSLKLAKVVQGVRLNTQLGPALHTFHMASLRGKSLPATIKRGCLSCTQTSSLQSHTAHHSRAKFSSHGDFRRHQIHIGQPFVLYRYPDFPARSNQSLRRQHVQAPWSRTIVDATETD